MAPGSQLAKLIEVFLRIGPLGFIAFGGPAVHVILFRRLFVLSPEPWLDSTTFADLFSLGGALPGPGSTQLLFSIAIVRSGVRAGLFAFFLFSLPGAIMMFLIALGVSHLPPSLPSIVAALLTGLNASSVGLIFFAALQLTRNTATTPITRIILFMTAAIGSCYSAVWLFPVLTIGGGVITLIADWSGWIEIYGRVVRRTRPVAEPTARDVALDEEIGGADSPSKSTSPLPPISPALEAPTTNPFSTPPLPTTETPSTLRHRPQATPPAAPPSSTLAVPVPPPTPINLKLSTTQTVLLIVLFASVLITVVVIQATVGNARPRALQLFTNLYIAGSILFGGGPVVVPLLQGYTVAPGWVSSQDFLLGFALLSALPGPNFNFAVFLGTLSLPQAPVLGGLLAYLGIFSPGILLKLAMIPTYSRFRSNRVVRASLSGLNSAASGLIWTAAFRLWKVGLLTSSGGASLEKSGYWASVAGAAFLASESFGVPAPAVIVGGACMGLIYGGVKGSP